MNEAHIALSRFIALGVDTSTLSRRLAALEERLGRIEGAKGPSAPPVGAFMNWSLPRSLHPACMWLAALALIVPVAGCAPGELGSTEAGCEDCRDGGVDRDDDDDESEGEGGSDGSDGGGSQGAGGSESSGSGAGDAASTGGDDATAGSSAGSGGSPTASGGNGGPLGDSAGPCTDCRVHVPSGYSPSVPAPLVVTLHGDEGRDYGTAAAASGSIDLWRAAADARGFIVVALACPADRGCNGAWSDWLDSEQYRVSDGNLGWLDEQVAAIEASYNIETRAEYLAGYSGGAYWLGYTGPARSSRFAGVAFIAGGMPAYHAYNGCPPCSIPGYFLGGDGDYRTEGQMSDTATAFNGCGQELQLDLYSGDHQQTIASLSGDQKALDILDWFLARPLACP